MITIKDKNKLVKLNVQMPKSKVKKAKKHTQAQ